MAPVLQFNRFFETIGNRTAESKRMRQLVELLIAQSGPEALDALSDAIAAGTVRELRRFRPGADFSISAASALDRFEELESISAQGVHDTALRASADSVPAAPVVIKHLAILTFSKAAKALAGRAEDHLVMNQADRLELAVAVLNDTEVIQATQALSSLVAGVAAMIMITRGRPV